MFLLQFFFFKKNLRNIKIKLYKSSLYVWSTFKIIGSSWEMSMRKSQIANGDIIVLLN